MAQGTIVNDDNGPQDPAPKTTAQQIRDELKARGWTDAQIDHYMNVGGTPEDPIIMGPEDPSPKNPGAIDLPLYPDNKPPPTKPAEEKPPTTTTGGGGGGTTPPPNPYTTPGADNPFGPWTGHFTEPDWAPTPDAPEFVPPTYTPPPAFSFDTPQPTFKEAPAFSYADFVPPSLQDAMQSPGYQLRLQQGTDRLQNAASARGTLNDSGTLKALIDYGQDSASQEYAHVFDRAVDTFGTNYKKAATSYDTNYNTQYVDPYNAAVKAWTTGHDTAVDDYNTNYKTQFKDPYDISYVAAKDSYAPRLLTWENTAKDIAHRNDVTHNTAWDDYKLGWDDYEARRRDALNFALGS